MNTAGTRLRRTFRYPTESDPDQDVPPDEEEQERIIEELKTRNSRTNAQFTTLTLALTVLCVLPYIPILFTKRKLLAILSISSLASTAYLLHVLPPGKTGMTMLDERQNGGLQGIQQESMGFNGRGPLLRYLPYLNLFLTGIILLSTLIAGSQWADQQHSQLLNVLPLAIYLFTLLVKVVMGSVDVEELAALKYDYKGA